jgi:NADH-quinone oxidoreductase subunit H
VVLAVVLMIIKSVVICTLLLAAFAYLTYIERKILARFQLRPGPNRVGPLGLLQPLADGLKMALKEEIVPQNADLLLYLAAPGISLLVALLAYAIIPWGPPLHVFGQTVPMQIFSPNVGVLFVLAMTSLGVYGITFGGWASQSKYALLGSLRSTAQLISYELAMGLALTGVLIMAGATNVNQIIAAQHGIWFFIPQFFGFLVYFISAVAETNRAPFDLVEAESELVAGYFTEYTGMKWAMYMMAEYINMITVSSLAATLFFGGWQGLGFLPWVPGVVWYLLKLGFFLFVFMWIRATLPRLRYDRLMNFGWKVLLPVAFVNTLGTAVFVSHVL